MSSRRVVPRALFALLVTWVAVRAHAGGSIEEVADCALRNLPPSAHARAALTSRAADASEKKVEIEYWSHTPDLGARQIVIARHGAPDNTVSALLFSDGDAVGEAWAVIAPKGKAKRITTSDVEVRLFGSNVSLEDFARFARVAFPGQVRRLDDAEIGGRKVYVVENKPSPHAGSIYSRIVTSIDREWCMILHRESFAESFEKGARPLKTYSVEPADVRVDGRFATATRARQDDARDGSSTRMEILELELPAKVGDDFFTPDALPRAAH
jgi:hypothetical protein